MSSSARCSRCNGTFAPARFDGMCPRCLLESAADPSPDPERAEPLRAGEHFRGLEILELLGRGGMGIVYRARHNSLGRDVALKILDPSLAAQPEFVARFDREARILGALGHPNIVGVFDSGREEGLTFLVMEFVRGKTLREHLSEGRPTPAEAERLALEIAAALGAAHAAGVIHRDIKPENILLDETGRVRVVDFGLAKPSSASHVTRTSAGMGTPHYMAPEQVTGARGVDRRADLYSLGVIFYEMLSGELPLGRFGPPSGDRRLNRAVLRLLEKDLDRRTPSVPAFLEDLKSRDPARSLRVLSFVAALAAGLGAAAWAVFPGVKAASPPPPPRPPAPAAWRDFGGSASGGGVSRTPGTSDHPCLALDSRGFPWVAWDEKANDRWRIYLRRWTGRTWDEVGGSASGDGLSGSPADCFRPSLALDPDERPVVAWVAAVGGRWEVRVRRWTGAAWDDLGGSSPESGISAGGRAEWTWLALDRSGNPSVAWSEWHGRQADVYFRRWNGSAWEELGGSGSAGGLSKTGGPVFYPKVKVDRSGFPFVAWEDHSPKNAEIYLRKWDGTSWAELAGSGSGGGVSRTPGSSYHPSLTLDSAGRPVLAWHEQRPVEWDIYLRRWDGQAWVEVGGSATEGGISDNLGPSHQGVVAIGPDDRPVVAWHDDTADNWEIYLRRWNGAAWEELGGSATAGGLSRTPGRSIWKSVQVDARGNPVVAWTEEMPGNFEIYCTGFRPPDPP